MDRVAGFQKMNQLGSEGKPFLFIIDYETKHPLVLEIDEVPDNIWYNINGRSNISTHSAPTPSINLKKEPVSFSEYKQSFDIVQSALHAGDSYLTNLTFETPITLNLSLQDIFCNSTAPYRLMIENQFVVFSPEVFVTIENNTIASYPMKGTINADIPNAYDKIMADPKEAAEHATIVDLIRNDLSMVAENVHVKRYRYIDEIKTHTGKLLQVSSEISGNVPDNWQSEIGSILLRLLPAGSICGAPKPRTLEIIAEAETYNRGYYTGIFGCFDGKKLDSAVMIRFIEQKSNTFVFKSGGGITALSNCQDEYQELIEKIYVPFT